MQKKTFCAVSSTPLRTIHSPHNLFWETGHNPDYRKDKIFLCLSSVTHRNEDSWETIAQEGASIFETKLGLSGSSKNFSTSAKCRPHWKMVRSHIIFSDWHQQQLQKSCCCEPCEVQWMCSNKAYLIAGTLQYQRQSIAWWRDECKCFLIGCKSRVLHVLVFLDFHYQSNSPHVILRSSRTERDDTVHNAFNVNSV